MKNPLPVPAVIAAVVVVLLVVVGLGYKMIDSSKPIMLQPKVGGGKFNKLAGAHDTGSATQTPPTAPTSGQ